MAQYDVSCNTAYLIGVECNELHITRTAYVLIFVVCVIEFIAIAFNKSRIALTAYVLVLVAAVVAILLAVAHQHVGHALVLGRRAPEETLLAHVCKINK